MMEELKEEDVVKFVEHFCITKYRDKPLLFWFTDNRTIDRVRELLINNDYSCRFQDHPFKHHVNCIIDGKVDNISNHPELLSNNVLPSGCKEHTTRLIYHTYLGQLDQEKLQYCIDLSHTYPVICLVNTYAKDEMGAVDDMFLKTHFENYCVIHTEEAEKPIKE